LETLDGLNLPTLIRLFVAKNHLKNLQGLKDCVNLTHLHARDNSISKLEDFPCLEKLEYVNLRGNALNRFSQTQFLRNSPNIRTLIAMDNPIATLDDYKMEMIAANLNLKRLDKQPVAEMDLVQGRLVRSGRENGTVAPPVDDEGLMTPEPEEEEEDGEYEEMEELEYSELEYIEEEPEQDFDVEVRKAST